MFQVVLTLVVCVVSSTWAVEVSVPPIRVDMPPPDGAPAGGRTVSQEFITMPLDHFDPQNSDTYQMRYMYNPQFFGGEGSPVFILVGGEWDIVEGWLRAGNMFEMARENNGYMIYTEHRYYGQSLPFRNFTTENLRFLNVDQALADLAFFIRDAVRSQPQFAQSKIILYGGSYAANMVLWFKQRYPHLVTGVVASSGPIKAEIDFTGYLEVVHEAFLSEGGEECISILRQGIADTIEALKTEEGRRLVVQNYRMCEPIDFDDPFEMGYFSGRLTWAFSGDVQRARPGTLLNVCNDFRSNVFGSTPMEKLGGYLAVRNGVTTSCWPFKYADIVATYSLNTNNRAWYYQTCTEYGFFQTAPRSGTVFDPFVRLNVDFYVDICRKAFDQRFDVPFVYKATERVNQVFGGLQPNVNNTINIHGYIDPWRALGVYDTDLKESSPTYTVPRASHCFDMQGWLSTDTIKMTSVQQTARRIVAGWIST